MKLADDALLMLVDIFRRGIIELRDVSQDLRDLDLVENSEGKLGLKKVTWESADQAETD